MEDGSSVGALTGTRVDCWVRCRPMAELFQLPSPQESGLLAAMHELLDWSSTCKSHWQKDLLHCVCFLSHQRRWNMAQDFLPGMESSAISVLKRAVELDQSSRLQESLVCYQEGIQLLIDVLKAVKDESKKVHYREKIKGYMHRAEQIKDHMNKLKEEGKYHEQVKIADNSTGFSYESLFKPYVRDGLTEVWVEDPYVRHVHQFYNFLRFCEMVLKGPCKVMTIHLLTSKDEERSSQQASALAEIKQSLQSQNVCLDIQFSSTIHDREIRFNNGWIIKIGRGLDYFKKPKARFSIGYCDYDLRECHETTVDIFHTKHTKTT